jgi:hypothetical protein
MGGLFGLGSMAFGAPAGSFGNMAMTKLFGW